MKKLIFALAFCLGIAFAMPFSVHADTIVTDDFSWVEVPATIVEVTGYKYNPDNSVDVRYNLVDTEGNLWEQTFNYKECIYKKYGTLKVNQECTFILVDGEYFDWCAGIL